MIQSMTGYGRAGFRVEGRSFDVEVRSVNHRYLDLRMRLPRPLTVFEPQVRERVQARFHRGRLELTVVCPESGGAAARVDVDLEAARRYARAAEKLRADEGLSGPVDVGTLLSLPGVARLSEPELAPEDLRRELLASVDAALAAVEAMRAAEGAALERELLSRLARVGALVDALETRADVVERAARERLRRRAEQIARETGVADDGRLQQEIAIAADRLDVTEEIVRLRSHAEQFRKIVESGGSGHPVGRRLDFLLQELGREANTLGSKAADAPVAHQIVELKTEIERLREQVQNVE